MNKLRPYLFLAFIVIPAILSAQDTLPKFLVKNVGNNRIVIGWTNKFENVRQISIQRSYDSLIQYKTILTVLDPELPQNGYVDTKAPGPRMFYRLYIMLDKGAYLFSVAKRPTLDTSATTITAISPDQADRLNIPPSINAAVALPNGDTAYITFPEVTVTNRSNFMPSQYVYTQKNGFVHINLPNEDRDPDAKALKKYSIKFFDEDNQFLFELKDLKTREFTLDKSNFYHAGWFNFEIYEDGKLFEKHKFYLAKEF